MMHALDRCYAISVFHHITLLVSVFCILHLSISHSHYKVPIQHLGWEIVFRIFRLAGALRSQDRLADPFYQTQQLSGLPPGQHRSR